MTPSEFARLFPEFRADSWAGWRDVLVAITPDVRELFVVAGRGSGKSRVSSLLAAYRASFDYPSRAPGEQICIGVFAPDRKQAGVTFRYVRGLLRADPSLARLIVNETRDSIELTHDVVVEVITASMAAPRGRSYALAIVEEAAFLPQDSSSNPDVELLRALRPALARVSGSLLCVIGSPYARRGVLWEAVQKYGTGQRPDVLVVQKPTLELNPTFDARAIERALEDDPVAARAEYLAEFRSDLETLLTIEALAAVTVQGRRELPPVGETQYVGFVDPAGGSGTDDMTLGIAHRDRNDTVVLDAVRRAKPPFSPQAVVEEFADTLRSYGLNRAVSDRYAGDWPVEAFARCGIRVEASSQSKSEIYLATVPLINSQRVELLDDARLLRQLGALERRTARGGRDTVDHPPREHDDLANAACGALVLASGESRPRKRAGLVF